MAQYIRPTINCKKKNIKKYLVFRKKPKNEIDFGLKKNQYLRYYYRCRVCGHLTAKHKNFFLDSLYKKKYFKSTYKSRFLLDKVFEKIINLPNLKSDNYFRVKRIKEMIEKNVFQKKLNLLDVGSGTGVFPFKIKSENIDVTALDPSKDCTMFIKNKSKSKIKILTGNFLRMNYKNFSKYNLITFNKVLEHVDEPILFLQKAKKLLKKNNLIYVEVPDAAAIKDKKEGKNREEFGFGHHHVFTKQSLKNILISSDFKIISLDNIREPSGKYTLYAFGKMK